MTSPDELMRILKRYLEGVQSERACGGFPIGVTVTLFIVGYRRPTPHERKAGVAAVISGALGYLEDNRQKDDSE